MNPLTSPSLGNAAQPLMQDSTAPAAQSSDASVSSRPRASIGKLLCPHAATGAIFGTITVVATHVVSSKLYQPTNNFLYDHCLSNMSNAQISEYGELDPYIPNTVADLAMTTTAFFIASAGPYLLYDAGKSIYDRICSCVDAGRSIYNRVCSSFRTPDPAVNQTEQV